MTRRIGMLATMLLVLAAGCSQEAMLQKFATDDEQARAMRYIDALRERRFEAIEKDAHSSIQGPELRPTLAQMAEMLPGEAPTSVKLVGAETLRNEAGTTVNITFQYGFAARWFLVNVAVLTQGGRDTITGFHVNPIRASLEEMNRFRLEGKSALHYAVLAMAIAFPLLTLHALVACVRTPLRGRKWLWILFIVVGIGHLGINWNTGEWRLDPIYFQLFSAGAFAPIYGPWTIAVSFPLGALVFLLCRRKLR